MLGSRGVPRLKGFSNAKRAFVNDTRIIKVYAMVACVASVRVRSERNSGSACQFFAFGTREKWGESKKAARMTPLRFPNFVRFVQERNAG